MYYSELFKALHKNNIIYVVVGGLAVNLHGIPRVTQDVDIVISFDEKNILKVNQVLKQLGYVPRLPVNPDYLADEKIRNDWINNKNMKAFSYFNPHEHHKCVDIVIIFHTSFSEIYKNRVTVSTSDFDIPVIGIDDLLEMKKFSGRKQDLSDIENLNKLKKYIKDGKNGS